MLHNGALAASISRQDKDISSLSLGIRRRVVRDEPPVRRKRRADFSSPRKRLERLSHAILNRDQGNLAHPVFRAADHEQRFTVWGPALRLRVIGEIRNGARFTAAEGNGPQLSLLVLAASDLPVVRGLATLGRNHADVAVVAGASWSQAA